MHIAWCENPGKQPVEPAWVQSLAMAVQQVLQVYRGPHDVNLPTRPFRFPCTVYMCIASNCKVMDPVLP